MSMQPEQKETPKLPSCGFLFYNIFRDVISEQSFTVILWKEKNYLSRHSGVDVIDWFEIK